MVSQENTLMSNDEIKPFSEFAKGLANLEYKEFAPPFESYSIFDGDIRAYIHDFFSIYISRVNSLNCLEKVNDYMIKHINTIRIMNGNEPLPLKFDIIAEIQTITDSILKALNNYYNGFPSVAYSILENAFKINNFHLLNLLPQLQLEVGNIRMYRIRPGVFDNDKDLFHVPFEQRYKCANYRFSINGTPSLYCGASLQTCILENRINSEKDITLAQFVFPRKGRIAFIDLALPYTKRMLTYWEEYSLVLFYPLIVSCGLKVKREDYPFKPEYIIPQLFYQILRQNVSKESGIEGISFTSTRYEKPDYKDFSQRNFVMFVKDCNQEKGYDNNLTKKLLISDLKHIKYSNLTDLNNIEKDFMQSPLRDIDLK